MPPKTKQTKSPSKAGLLPEFRITGLTLKHILAVQNLAFKNHFLQFPNAQIAARSGFTGAVYSKTVLKQAVLDGLSKVVVDSSGRVVGYLLAFSPSRFEKAFGIPLKKLFEKYGLKQVRNSAYVAQACLDPAVRKLGLYPQLSEAVYLSIRKRGIVNVFGKIAQNNLRSKKVHSNRGYAHLGTGKRELWTGFKGNDKELISKLKKPAKRSFVRWGFYKLRI